MQNEALYVTVRDMRACAMCRRGSRAFFARHNLDWESFLKVGILASELEETGDAMAIKVVGYARGRKQ